MTVLAAVSGLGFIFKDDDFIAFAFFLYIGQHPGALYDRCTGGNIVTIRYQKYLVYLHRAACFRTEEFNIYRLAFGYPVLFAACFYYCVNIGPR